MTQQEDITSQEPGARQPGAQSQAAAADPVPAADAVQPAPAPEPVWPSPYLSEGAAIPEAYPAPAQPGQPRYGEPGGSVPPGQPFSSGQPGSSPQGYRQPGNGQPGDPSAYGQPRYGQSRQSQGRAPSRLGTGAQVTGRDPALAAGWERFLAMTMDWFLIFAAAILLVLSPMLKIWHQLGAIYANSTTVGASATQTAMSNVLRSPAATSAFVRFWLIAFAIALVYFWALPAAWGGTLGKQVLGLRVVAAVDRSRVSIRAAGVRAVAFLAGPAILVLVPSELGLVGGLIWLADCTAMIVDSRMQSLHDRAADTTVIRKRWLDQQARPTQVSPW